MILFSQVFKPFDISGNVAFPNQILKKSWESQTDIKISQRGTSLVAQWIRFCTPNAGGLGSILGQGTRFHMHAATKSSYATTKELASHN